MEKINNDNNIDIFDSKQICMILNVKSIIKIEQRNKLEEMLLKENIKLIEKYKSGRKNLYKVQILQDNTCIESIAKKHHVKKKVEFGKHIVNRGENMENDKLITQIKYAQKAGVNRKLIGKFDNILLEEEFMNKDGFRYWIYKDAVLIGETTKNTYDKFWFENLTYKREIDKIYKRLYDKEITIKECNILYSNIITKMYENGYIIQRTRKFAPGSEFEKIFFQANKFIEDQVNKQEKKAK